MLAAIVQSSDAAIIGKTLDGIVTSWNPSAERIFGYSAAEMIGKPIHVLSSPDRPREMGEILRPRPAGERVEQLETQRRRKDGRLIHISLTVSPILDERGRIIGASKIARDITGRKSTEAQLRAKTAQLEEFTHALSLAPAMVRTPEGKILFWGRGLQILYGWSAEEAIGRISHELLRTEFPLPLAEIEAELRERGEWQGELQHSHKNGRRLTRRQPMGGASASWRGFVIDPRNLPRHDRDETCPIDDRREGSAVALHPGNRPRRDHHDR